MLWAAVTTAFFGFLRSSEYVSPQTHKYDPESTLCFEDITYRHPNFHIRIKTSKTDPFREGCTICISPSRAQICPVRNLLTYINQRKVKTGPLFTYTDNSLLTRRRLNSLLKNAIPSSNASPVSSHSLRIGVATTAASGGFPRWLIQQLGRWNGQVTVFVSIFRYQLNHSNTCRIPWQPPLKKEINLIWISCLQECKYL